MYWKVSALVPTIYISKPFNSEVVAFPHSRHFEAEPEQAGIEG